MLFVPAQSQTLLILCVDDEVQVLGVVTETLRAEGHEVQTAVDGTHALQKLALESRSFDLIIADARMPCLDGWRFLMQARAGGYEGKIIVFSAYMDDAERQRYHNLNIDRIIDKPDARALVQAVNDLAGM